MRSFTSALPNQSCATLIRGAICRSTGTGLAGPGSSSPSYRPSFIHACGLTTVGIYPQTTMASKRKKSTASTAAGIKDEPPSPSLLSPAPRRSARQRSNNETKQADEGAVSLHPQTDSKMNIIASSDQHMLQSRAGVRQAMKDLHDMDERLHSNAKRQRLAVENSHLQVNREGYENTSIHPLPIQARSPDKKLKMECVLDKPSKLQDIEAAPMDDDDAKDLAERLDEDAADAEPDGIDESAKRGASRPPAVNSDRLPLPWKGRLGYVSPLEVKSFVLFS